LLTGVAASHTDHERLRHRRSSGLAHTVGDACV